MGHSALFILQNGVVSVADTLTAKQQRFVEEYMVDLNATQAAIRAGYSEKTANVIASETLAKPYVAAEIQARRAAMSEKLEITRDWVLQELAAIAKADAANYAKIETVPEERLGIHPITGEIALLPIGWCQYVKVIDTANMPAFQRAALAGIKQGKHGVEIRLHDKVRALEMLGKHLGLFEPGAAPPQTAENNLFDAITGKAREGVKTDEIPELEQAATAGDDLVESPKP